MDCAYCGPKIPDIDASEKVIFPVIFMFDSGIKLALFVDVNI